MARAPDGARPLRLGVFGGTFDPPHVGHVAVARDVADALELDRVLWIPARIPPHKQDVAISPGAARLDMVRVACASDPRFEACGLELEREGPSFTVDTLRELAARNPGAELYLILGADQVRMFERGWKEPEEILRLATLALMDREGETAQGVGSALSGVERAVHVPVTRVDVSATRIRAALAAGKDVAALVPAGVLEVATREGLYGRAARRRR